MIIINNACTPTCVCVFSHSDSETDKGAIGDSGFITNNITLNSQEVVPLYLMQ